MDSGSDVHASVRVDEWLAGTLPLEQAVALGPEALAWALKDACQAAWANDPERCRAAAVGLQTLAQQHPAARVLALAQWAAGIGALAESQFVDALTQLQGCVASWNDLAQPLWAAQASVAMLMPLTLLGRFDEAWAVGQNTEQALNAHGDAQGAAKMALNLGSLALQRDRYPEAALHYRRAAIRFARLGDREHSVMADTGLADSMGAAGHIDEALRVYRRAEMRARQHDLPVLGAAAQHGRALLALGRGQYRQALAGLVQAQRAFSHFRVDHYLSEVDRDLADAYLDLRMVPEALAVYGPLVLRLQAHGNEATVPWVLLQQARAMALVGRNADAAAGLANALQMFKDHGNAAGADLAELVGIEWLLSLSHAEAPARAAAEGCADRAAALAQRLPEGAACRARMLQAIALRHAGRLVDALALLQTLSVDAEAAVPPPLQARAWDETGRVLDALGQPTAATTAWERAIAVFEDLRAALPGDDFQIALLSDHLHPYQARLERALCSESPDGVLAWLDRYRARVLSERLGRPADIASFDDDTRHAVVAMRERLNWIRRQNQRRTEEGDAELPVALRDEARHIEHTLLETTRRARAMAHLDTGTGALPDSAGSHALPTLQQTLDTSALCLRFSGAEALVEYGVVGDELLAVVVAGGRIQVLRDLASIAAVILLLRRLRFQLDALRIGRTALEAHEGQLLQRCTHHLQALHGAVWAPLQAALGGATDIVVVPCAALQGLPFAGLNDGQRWLDETARIRLATSAAHTVLRSAAAKAKTRGDTGLRVLIGESSQLPHVRAELTAAAAVLAPASVLMDEAASVQAALAAMADADLLHLACHADFRSDSPRHSALHLNDGVLTAAEIEEQHIGCGLVVLSACNTGRTDVAIGDEGIGLVRAFLVAGAHEVVASLWAVDDEATALLMAGFYRHRTHSQQNAGRALQRARHELRQSHPHPYHWASFVLYGAGEM